MRKFRLKADRFQHSAGTICHPYVGYDYGLVSDDSHGTGVEHVAMTLDPLGGAPFFTVPVSDVERVA